MSSSASTADWRPRGVFSVEIVERRAGIVVFSVEGEKAAEVFKDETGGHKWQRVPPTEKRGRVQTSAVTVAVLQEPTPTQVVIRDSDLVWSYCRSSGKGGQGVNTTDSAVHLSHLPSKIAVRCESERSQAQNKRTALALLRAKLWETKRQASTDVRADERRQQIGSGARGNKRRVIRVQDGIVVDSISGRRWRYKDYVRGEW